MGCEGRRGCSASRSARAKGNERESEGKSRRRKAKGEKTKGAKGRTKERKKKGSPEGRRRRGGRTWATSSGTPSLGRGRGRLRFVRAPSGPPSALVGPSAIPNHGPLLPSLRTRTVDAGRNLRRGVRSPRVANGGAGRVMHHHRTGGMHWALACISYPERGWNYRLSIIFSGLLQIGKVMISRR